VDMLFNIYFENGVYSCEWDEMS